MGVVASMSVSLIDRGRLWGLVACHHYAGPHRPSYADRVAAEFLGRTASLLLHTTVAAGEQRATSSTSPSAPRSSPRPSAARPARPLRRAHRAATSPCCDLLPAAGAAVRLDGRLRLLGTTPPAERVGALVRRCWPPGRRSPTPCRGCCPQAADLADTASGVLAVPVGAGRGLPRLVPARDPARGDLGRQPARARWSSRRGPRLSPRRSFDAWTEIVRGTARAVAGARGRGRPAARRAPRRAARGRAEQENRLAAALQRTLLLEQLPEVPGVDLAARYLPSADDVVGGDWYDLVPLPSGRVSLVLGDVAGHGLGAAPSPPSCGTPCGPPAARPRPGRGARRLNRLVGAAAARGDGDRRRRRAGPGDRRGRRRQRRAPAGAAPHGAAAGFVDGRPRAGAGPPRRAGTPRRGCGCPATSGCCCSATAWSSGAAGPERGLAALQARRPGGRARSRCSTPSSPRSRRRAPTTSPCWASAAPEPHPSHAVWRHALVTARRLSVSHAPPHAHPPAARADGRSPHADRRAGAHRKARTQAAAEPASATAPAAAPPTPPPPVLVPWPLTGVAVEAPPQRPALAVKVENSVAARPQSGLNAADVVWEEVVEGGITRFVAVYHSNLPPDIGPICSAARWTPPSPARCTACSPSPAVGRTSCGPSATPACRCSARTPVPAASSG